jgi:type II secretory pathway pseudopilin PulG
MLLSIKNSRQSGSTLIETILYMGIVTIFLSALILFAWDIIYSQIKSQVQQDLNHNLQFTSQRLSYEIRSASAINSVSNSSISLANDDLTRNPTVIDLVNGQIRLGFGSTGNCPSTSPCPLTASHLNVDQLQFTDLSDLDTQSIKFSITISSTGDRQEWQGQQSITSSSTLRVN